jgi:hypothetical protein
MEESQGLDALMPRGGGGAGSYLLVVAEGPADEGGSQGGGARSRRRGGGGGGSSGEEEDGADGGGGGGGGGLAVGVVAVDAASGDVVYGVTSGGGAPQSGLEAALLALAPAEVVALDPLSADTARLLERFAGPAARNGGGGGDGSAKAAAGEGEGGGSGGRARRGRFASGGGGGGPGPRVARLVRQAGPGYLDAAAAAALSDLYAPPGGNGSAGAAGGGGGGASGGGGDQAGGGGGDALGFVMALPPLVLRALAGAVSYLAQFGLAGALGDVGSFRPLAAARGLVLSSNALQQLELLTTGGWAGGGRGALDWWMQRQAQLPMQLLDGRTAASRHPSPSLTPRTRHPRTTTHPRPVEGAFKGSLLHLLDRTTTGMGARLLRRWVAHPLADRGRIVERLDAVEVRGGSFRGGWPEAINPLSRFDQAPPCRRAPASARAVLQRPPTPPPPTRLARSSRPRRRPRSRCCPQSCAACPTSSAPSCAARTARRRPQRP